MKILKSCAALALWIAGTSAGVSQTTVFDVDAYRQFLASHQNLSTTDLQAMHPAGSYGASIPAPGSAPLYLDTMSAKSALTPFELEQIGKHGFVVTSRLSYNTFVQALEAIYRQDLPVFVSTDAILQAIHNSYDRLLKEMELSILRPELIALLTDLHGQLPALEAKYSTNAGMHAMLRDADVYCTIPLLLLGQPATPYYSDNQAWVSELLKMIGSLQPREIPLFGSGTRIVDFSQFTVRGHYTQDTLLAKYFRAMIWLGRTEIYLNTPEGATPPVPFADVQRQMIDAALVAEAVRTGGVLPHIQAMDRILSFMVGEPDNVTVDSLQALLSESGIDDATALLDSARCVEIQNLLATKSYAGQRIISQILMTDPLDPTQLAPAPSFLLLGQRFVIDSYVTGNVVYDKILYDGSKITRMLPSSLDVLFALGNNAAGRLLKNELEMYHYASNAAAMRYLIDSYGPEFWSASMFNAWLDIIRALNPPADRTALPAFMQTAAWWQEKMNTQLASWAQLRHDNLLYAKQSYSGGAICSFPESYVEPVPRFFQAVKSYAELGAANFGAFGDAWIQDYFLHLAGVADTLRGIAEKELVGTPLGPDERLFLRAMLMLPGVCGAPPTGWYPRLFYGGSFEPGSFSECMTIADVHTAPTDAAGNLVGWVLHAGTGPVEMAVVCATLPDRRYHAFIGPVLSYYEHLATDFKRLTDEEWVYLYNVAPSLRPDFVNLYLANNGGASRGAGPSLATSIPDEPSTRVPLYAALHPNYPNPFNGTTIVPFSITGGAQQVSLEIFDVQGQLVARLLQERLPAGNYTAVWRGNTIRGSQSASGVYMTRLRAGDQLQVRKMVLMR